MTLGERLRQLRQSRGLSQEEVAQRLYLTRQSISKWENNQAEPGVENLKVLAALYGVTVDELVGNEAAPPAFPPPEEERLPDSGGGENGCVRWYRYLVATRSVIVVVTNLILQELSFPFDLLLMLLGLGVRNSAVWVLTVLCVVINLVISTTSSLMAVSMPFSLIFVLLHGAVLWAVLRPETKKYFHLEKE